MSVMSDMHVGSEHNSGSGILLALKQVSDFERVKWFEKKVDFTDTEITSRCRIACIIGSKFD